MRRLRSEGGARLRLGLGLLRGPTLLRPARRLRLELAPRPLGPLPGLGSGLWLGLELLLGPKLLLGPGPLSLELPLGPELRLRLGQGLGLPRGLGPQGNCRVPPLRPG
ncbi:MAG TPA: hypothetical protein VGD67_09935 [Pseudonocardiaceae bacterium]